MFGHAKVYGYATIRGNAVVSGKANIYGYAVILGGTWNGSEGPITEGTWKSPAERIK